MSVNRIGIDVGGVIIGGTRDDPADTSFFGDNFLKTNAIEGAVASIKLIVNAIGRENTFIISRAGATTAGKSLIWLNEYKVVGRGSSQIDIMNIRFCFERRDKTPIATELQLDAFIDDKADVLQPMHTVKRRILFGTQSNVFPDELETAESWEAILKTLGI